MKLLLRSLYLGVALASGVHALAQGDPATLDRIVDQGKNHSQVMRILHDLTGGIGPRLTSSPRLAKAEQWASDQFRKFGCTNVHLEKWGDTPVGWDRGPLQMARMVEPFDSPMVFTVPAWTDGTKGVVRARVVRAPTTMEELEKVKPQLKGAWVLFPGAASARRGADTAGTVPLDVAQAIDASGIAGRIYGSRNELVVTSGTWANKTYENHPGTLRVTVRKSDYDRLDRNLEFGRNVVVEIGAESHWYKGPVPQYNVVAEIKGTEKPDEVVIVSGHLDSWNGPGSQGALDNGVGSSTALEAARILCAAHAKPKRTIRFILWTGEEEGLYGSRAYVQQHAAELDKISAVLVDDGGTNYQGGYEILEQMKPMMEAAIAKSQAAFPDMPQKLEVVKGPRMPRGGGSDHAPFNSVGVPGFFTIETGRSDYGYVHHTQHDRYEMAIPEYLVQSATNHALVSYNLACADTLLPREPKPEPAPTDGG